jgi:hypothetical protein
LRISSSCCPSSSHREGIALTFHCLFSLSGDRESDPTTIFLRHIPSLQVKNDSIELIFPVFGHTNPRQLGLSITEPTFAFAPAPHSCRGGTACPTQIGGLYPVSAEAVRQAHGPERRTKGRRWPRVPPQRSRFGRRGVLDAAEEAASLRV